MSTGGLDAPRRANEAPRARGERGGRPGWGAGPGWPRAPPTRLCRARRGPPLRGAHGARTVVCKKTKWLAAGTYRAASRTTFFAPSPSRNSP